MAINRFKEMIDVGIAPARYDDRFSKYKNNANYHSMNDITRKYNCVWGALTDTNMRYDEELDEYIISGSQVSQRKWQMLMDREWFDTTYFNNSFKGTNIYTMNQFFKYYNLIGEFTTFNGEIVYKLKIGLDDICNTYNDIWGDLTDSNMTVSNGFYYINNYNSDIFNNWLDKEFNGMCCFADDCRLKERNCKTLRDYMNCIDMIPTEEDKCTCKFESLKSILSKAKEIKENFKDSNYLIVENETWCSSDTYDKYEKYVVENRDTINWYVKALINTNKNDILKECAYFMFPFSNITETSELGINSKNPQWNIEGVGIMSRINENTINLFLNNKDNVQINSNQEDIFEDLIEHLDFIQAQ